MRRSRAVRRTLPATLMLAGCGSVSVLDAGQDAGQDAGRTDAGTDAGYDAGMMDAGTADGGTDAGCAPSGNCTPYVNACGQNCGCVGDFLPDGGFAMVGYCDPDIGNPCPLECFNPREADGGRQYTDAGPVCFC